MLWLKTVVLSFLLVVVNLSNVPSWLDCLLALVECVPVVAYVYLSVLLAECQVEMWDLVPDG